MFNHLDKTETINAYVIENEARLKRICFGLYRGNDKWQDLFQEFYLAVINAKDSWYQRYDLKQLCYWTIMELFYNRQRSAALKELNYVDINGVNLPIEEKHHFDLMDKIDFELQKKEGFLSMVILKECVDSSVREVAKETGLNYVTVFKHKKAAQKKLRDYFKDDRN